MFNPISPEFVRIIHQDKERELERRIAMARTARERGEVETTWFAQAAQWVRERLSRRANAHRQSAAFKKPYPPYPEMP